jgi:ABC-type sugar transport system ATPase subunit
MTRVVLEGVVKRYAGGTAALDGIDLIVEAGELMVVVGPSGAGKSTLLRVVAGLEAVSGGSIAIGGRDVTRIAPRERDVAMVFQDYALFPHLTVAGNLGYGLRVRRTPRAETRRRVDEVAHLLELEPFLARKPASLSGGERQRVALGRAIARRPSVFLMDEPLSSLDPGLRLATRRELRRLHERLSTTTLHVTHDQAEATALGDRVAVLNRGRVAQVGTPSDLHHRPANVFVAGFVGTPPMNLVPAEAVDGAVCFAGRSVALARGRRPGRGGPLLLGIRPRDLAATGQATGRPAIAATVETVEAFENETLAACILDAAQPIVVTASVGAGARAGDRTLLSLDPERFHFFDRESGAAI